MATENEPILRQQSEYKWPEPNFRKLTEAVKITLDIFKDADVKFESKIGQYDLLSFTTEYEYTSYESWCQGFEEKFTSTHIRINDWQRSLNIDIAVDLIAKIITIWARAPKTETQNIRQLHELLEQKLGLEKKQDVTDSIFSFMERYYFCQKPTEADSFIEALNQLNDSQESRNLYVEIFYAAPSGSGTRYHNNNEWRRGVVENWTKITALNYNIRDISSNINLRWNFVTDELRLTVEAQMEVLVEAKLKELEQYLQIVPHEGRLRGALEGGERVFFSQNEVSKQWFETAVEIITGYLRSDFYSDLRLKIESPLQQTLVWQNVPAWKISVIDNWEEMTEATGYFSGPGLTLNFRYDHRRERIVLEIRAATKEKADKIFDHFIKRLDLKQSEHDTYSHARSSGYFSIKTFSYGGFEQAVKDAIGQFIKNKYYILEATVIEPTDDERKAVQKFTNFTSFLNRIGNKNVTDKEYDEAHLKLHGPRGAAIGIHLLDKRNKLEIKSSLQPNEFLNLIQVFKSNIGLKKIADTKDAAETQKKSLKDSAWVLIMLPIFLSLLTNAFLTDRIKNAPFSNNTLEILTPSSISKDKPIIIYNRTVPISWRVVQEKWLNKKFFEKSEATVRIRDSIGGIVEQKPRVLPGITFNLKPGAYSAEVFLEEYGLIEKANFSIAPNSK